MKALSAADSAASPATKITIPYYSAAAGAGEAGPPFGKGRYKVWALAAIALLALWSMSAASASLRWSSGRFLLAATASEDLDAPLLDDLDSLEMEEREKLVGRMWDMYTRTGDEVRLPRFWQEAFEAAYEELAGDDMQVRDAAISEIARMSAHRLELEQPVNEEEKTRSNEHGSPKLKK
ncbi:uncharacterized protein [Oryza sativa Japonica Group]|uniref:Expressed protein n=6 Tax=Oryza TaxID=4527 RepID=Q10JQ8_ORYSJ|nr:uncharacterized protein LOC4333097 [Oryza sativa Japonica Group]XP_052146361.1 uncharacterized protein LOC127765488 [Oryza glaberrima]EAY90431.1 hypothetical protein OsI_12018 [Oryza sativa Indica Group]AAO37508.1 expressed protein [Oryza sativa Japonica Group]ABF96570.1 expressed protein [Oryza sativa Japonica Group]EAZ27304.1 hypothetical protein OsJ_11244 [Oryza sativa Japonica Group]KAF2939698.1 hypothetical protein DAI22_03g214500 [Oryza sativa Japonica Group]|eukprot:NP_001050350.1 Os03g0411600 [Oryza sativa Japonica Group]